MGRPMPKWSIITKRVSCSLTIASKTKVILLGVMNDCSNIDLVDDRSLCQWPNSYHHYVYGGKRGTVNYVLKFAQSMNSKLKHLSTPHLNLSRGGLCQFAMGSIRDL